MIVGIPKEIKTDEYRVGATPAGVMELIKAGHEVLVQVDAGIGSGFDNGDYVKVGVTLSSTADEIYNRCEMIMKVKEPIEAEYEYLREGQILFTYLHLAADND
jgi:alanine dehydrogenase